MRTRIACYGFDPDWGFISNDSLPFDNKPATRHANGLWLRAPGEPFAPPVIDFLMEQFGEPDRTPWPGGVTTYEFRSPGGLIRVTADDPSLRGGLSAWWVHADTPHHLATLARTVGPWCQLRADTDPARAALAKGPGCGL